MSKGRLVYTYSIVACTLSHPIRAVAAGPAHCCANPCSLRAASWCARSINSTLSSLIGHTWHPYNNRGIATDRYTFDALIGFSPPLRAQIPWIIYDIFLWIWILASVAIFSACFILHRGTPRRLAPSTLYITWLLLLIDHLARRI